MRNMDQRDYQIAARRIVDALGPETAGNSFVYSKQMTRSVRTPSGSSTSKEGMSCYSRR